MHSDDFQTIPLLFALVVIIVVAPNPVAGALGGQGQAPTMADDTQTVYTPETVETPDNGTTNATEGPPPINESVLTNQSDEVRHPHIQDSLLESDEATVQQGIIEGVDEGPPLVEVIIHSQNGEVGSALTAIGQANGSIIGRYENQIQAQVPQEALSILADSPAISYIREPIRPEQQDVTTEGFRVLNASGVHVANYTGDNVTVAVIDFAFDPSNSEISENIIATRSFGSGTIDQGDTTHGTATAEIVQDIAPNASLILVSVDSVNSLLRAINWLDTETETDAVSISLAYYGEGPYDGSSTLDQAVQDSVQNGIQWVVSAGNSANGRHWNGVLTDPDNNDVMNISNTQEAFNVSVRQNSVSTDVHLVWNDWVNTNQNYDLYVVNEDGDILRSSENEQDSGFINPIESVRVYQSDDNPYIYIVNENADQSNEFHLWTGDSGRLDPFNDTQSITPPATALGAISVGAIDQRDRSLEAFSSRGPTVDGRTAPDLVAPDRVSTSARSPRLFPGTSAAAPHIAGVAAVLIDANETLSPAQIRSTLTDTAIPVLGTEPNNQTGSGLVDAFRAVREVETTPPVITDVSITDMTDGDGVVRDGDRITVSVRATDNIGISGVVVDGSNFGTDRVSLTDQNNDRTYTTVITVNTESSAPAGSYRVPVTAGDSANNRNTTYSNALRLNTTTRTNDALEPNDGFETASPVEAGQTYQSLQLVSTEVDVYSVQMDAGEALASVIAFDHGTSDLDMAVYASNGTYIDGSFSTTNNESVTITADTSGSYYVAVASANNQSAPYDLLIETGAEALPENDRFEPNGQFTTASIIEPGQTYRNLQIVTSEIDVYAIQLEAGQLLTSGIGFDHNTSDLDMAIYAPNGTYLNGSFSLTDDELTTVTASTTGTYYVAVESATNQSASYALGTSVESARNNDRFESNDEFATATVIEPDQSYTDLQITTGDLDVFAVQVEEGRLLTSTIQFAHSTSDLDIAVYGPDQNYINGSFSVTDDETADLTTAESGFYYIVVYGYDNASAPYDLEVQTANAQLNDRLEPNNGFTTATASETNVTYSNLQITDGESDIFAVDVGAARRLTATIQFAHSTGDLDIAVYGSDQNYINGSFSVTDNETVAITVEEEGTYFVEVYGYSGASAPYDLSLQAAPTELNDRFEPNNEFTTATQIDVGNTYRDLHIENGEFDVFAVEMTAGQTLTSTMLFDHSVGDLDIAVYGPDRDYITGNFSVTDDETVTFTANVSGIYYLAPHGYEGASAPYDLAVGTESQPQEARVHVFTTTGGALPRNSDGDFILARDVQNNLRIEVYPRESDAEALPDGIAFSLSGPYAEESVQTTTQLNSSIGTNLVTDSDGDGQADFERGQVGFLSVTPTASGDEIITLDSADVAATGPNGEPVEFDVRQENLQINISLSRTAIVAGDSLTVSLSVASTGESLGQGTRVGLTDPSGTQIASAVTDLNGEVSFTLPASAANGTYTLSTQPAGFAPASTEFAVLSNAGFRVSNLSPGNTTVTQGAVINISADIENGGGSTATQVINFSVNRTVVATETLTLSAGERLTITFQNINTSTLPVGRYTYTIASADDRQSARLTVQNTTESSESELADYTTSSGVVSTAGLQTALSDWSRGDLSTTQLIQLLDAWSSGSELT